MPRMDGAQFAYRFTETPPEVMEKEARENARLRQITEKLRSKNLELSISDLLGTQRGAAHDSQQTARSVLTEKEMFAGLSPEEAVLLRQELAQEGHVIPQTPVSRQQSVAEEDLSSVPQQRVIPAKKVITWSSQQMKARLKSGAEVPVWKVVDSKTGMEMPTPFRIQEVADRIAAILNETGNVNHPSIVSTVGAYNKRIQIMKEMKAVKQAISEGVIAKKPRLQQLQGELAQVDMKLGI